MIKGTISTVQYWWDVALEATLEIHKLCFHKYKILSFLMNMIDIKALTKTVLYRLC